MVYQKENKMKAVILAGGFGKRLRIALKDIPKPMAPILDNPFLEHQINLLKKQGIKDIILCLHYLADQIHDYFKDGRDFGVNIEYSIEETPLGTGGAIKAIEKYIEDTFIVMNGDSYTDINFNDLVKYHKINGNKYTLVGIDAEKAKSKGNIQLRDTKIVRFLEEEKMIEAKFVNAGVYIFEPSIFEEIPENTRIQLETSIFPRLASRMELDFYEARGYFIDIGIPETYQKFIEDIYIGKIDVKEQLIRGRSPLRINFAACGNDLDYIFNRYGGYLMSATIDKFCHASIKKRFDGKIFVNNKENENSLIKEIINYLQPQTGFDLYYHNDIPPGMGLGSSGSFVILIISLIAELESRRYSDPQIIEMSKEIETRAGIKGGWQDFISALKGGINFIEFSEDKKISHTLNIKKNLMNELNAHLFLVNTGIKRESSAAHEEQEEYYSLNNILEIKRIAEKIKDKLLNSDVNIGKLIGKAWENKKEMISRSLNEEVNMVDRIINREGAVGKLMGAGKGGCFLVYCKPEEKEKLMNELKNYEILNFNLHDKGVETWYGN